MMLAQQLYERGFITYMRTDSVNFAEKFFGESRAWLIKELGEKIAAPEGLAQVQKQKKDAQEAHEAVRPTDAGTHPESLAGKVEPDQLRLYDLIWRRAMASQMSEAVLDQTSATMTAKGATAITDFRANGMTIGFDGYYRIYPTDAKETILPDLAPEEKLSNSKSSKASSISPNRRRAIPTLRSLKRWKNTASAAHPPTRRPSPRSSTAITWSASRTAASSPPRSPLSSTICWSNIFPRSSIQLHRQNGRANSTRSPKAKNN